jgi:hypothetical protein
MTKVIIAHDDKNEGDKKQETSKAPVEPPPPCVDCPLWQAIVGKKKEQANEK